MIRWKKKIYKFLFFSYESESRAYIVLKQSKYFITKYDVPAIIEQVKAMSKKISTKKDQSKRDEL